MRRRSSAALREAVSWAEAAEDVREQAEALRRIGWNQGRLGSHAEAIATLREAVTSGRGRRGR
jgi:Flp pilus assembly protein TadD